jgi:competence ComEA-like helix-hairpin-helix protein
MKTALFAMAAFAGLFCAAAQDLPEAPGKAAVEKLCSNCHGLATIMGLRHTTAEWQSTVDDMVGRGMSGTDEEIDAVISYLARNLGKVNVNQAAEAEIELVLGISESEAQAIVKFRGTIGKFQDLDALKRVPGIDQKAINDRKDRIAF